MNSTGLSKKQIEVLQFPYLKEYDGIICDGSIRSGKTVCESISFVLWAMSNFNHCNFGLCSKTIGVCERNIKEPLMNIKYFKQNGFEMKYKSTETKLVITRGNKENYFYLFGGKDESSQNLVQGITLAGALLDEVALMPKSFVNQVLARCSVEGSKWFFSCNPSHPNHWFLLEYIRKSDIKHLKYLHFSMDDNPSLSKEKKEQYKRNYEGVFFKRFILGEWCSAEGLIYRKFADNNEKYIVDTIDKDQVWFIEVGLDFGNNLSSHTIVATAFFPYFSKLVIVKEKKISESIDSNRLAKEFIIFVNELYQQYGLNFYVRPDNAETTLINTLQSALYDNGITFCRLLNARKSPINERINLTAHLFGNDKLFVKKDCVEMIKAFNSAVWDEKNPDKRQDIVGHENPIDMLDAFEYSIESYNEKIIKTL